MVRLATNVSDPIGDLLARIRNANLAYKDDLVIPASKMNEAIVKILAAEGFVGGYEPEGDGLDRTLRVTLKYGSKRERTITGLKRGADQSPARARWSRRRDRVDVAGCDDGP